MAQRLAGSFKRLFRRIGLQIERARLGQDMWTDLEQLLRRRDSPFILDVGANRGQAACIFAARFPSAHIVSFEPAPRVFEELVRETSHLRGVTPVNLALGSEEASQTIFINRSSTLTSFLPLEVAEGWGEIIGEVPVTVTTLDHLASTEGWETIDLLKTDTQGFDLQVLKGAVELLEAHRVYLVQTEVNFATIYRGQAAFESIYEFLTGRGFKMVGLYNGHYYDDPFLWWADSLFIDPAFIGNTRKKRPQPS